MQREQVSLGSNYGWERHYSWSRSPTLSGAPTDQDVHFDYGEQIRVTGDSAITGLKAPTLFCLALPLSSCMGSDASTEMYVCVAPAESKIFLNHLAELVAPMGYKASIGRAIDAQNHTRYVLEANKSFVGIWAQNTEIFSPTSDKLPIPNPYEYYVAAQGRWPFQSSKRALFDRLYKMLAAKGYKISRVETGCGISNPT